MYVLDESHNDWWEGEYMGVAVGVLVTVILLLVAVIVFIFYKNHTTSMGTLEDGSQEDKANYAAICGGAETLYRTRRLPPTPPTSEDHYTGDQNDFIHSVHVRKT